MYFTLFKFKSIVFIYIICLIISVSAISSNHPGHGKKFGSSGPFLNIDDVTSISTKDFFQNYVTKKKPLLIRSGFSQTNACSYWTDEYLANLAKDHNDVKLVVETEKKESRDQEIINLSLTEFIKEYKSKEIYLVNDVPFYLRQDVYLPQPLQCNQAPETLEETVCLSK
jgi:hypothetical protein